MTEETELQKLANRYSHLLASHDALFASLDLILAQVNLAKVSPVTVCKAIDNLRTAKKLQVELHNLQILDKYHQSVL